MRLKAKRRYTVFCCNIKFLLGTSSKLWQTEFKSVYLHLYHGLRRAHRSKIGSAKVDLERYTVDIYVLEDTK